MSKSFDVEWDGDLLEFECDTKELAEKAADEWWNKKHEDNGESYANGETVEGECNIVEFHTGDGDPEVFNTTTYPLEYEYYHGDDEEHNVRWNQ